MRISACIQNESFSGLLIETRGGAIRLAFTDICCVEVMGKNVFFHMKDERTEEVRITFSYIEAELLKWPDFIKVHRAYMINMQYAERMEAGCIILSNGHSVPVSKRLYPEIKKNWLRRFSAPSAVPVPDRENPVLSVGGPYSILLVDDREDDLIRWSQLLTEKGCRVQTAATGSAALFIAGGQPFDCVVLDVLLGEEKGFDLSGKLRELTGAPVVYFSILTDMENQMQGFLTGGIDYITKDISPDLFWLKIRTRIETSRILYARLCMGGLCLDLNNRKGYLRGQDILLTPTEFDLLHIFMKTPGEIYAPSRLYEMIKGYGQRDNGQTIQIHLARLAHKLETVSSGRRFIESVWGTGYRFVPGKEDADEIG